MTVDRRRSHRLAVAAWEAVVDIAHGSPVVVVPWELRSEAALVFAFEEARNIGLQRRALEESRSARWAAYEADREGRRRLDAAVAKDRRHRAEVLTPSAETMLAQLMAGESLALNGHSLSWDKPFGMLTGTNAYGHDYCWGSITVESVKKWRAALLDGRILGRCPPGGDGDLNSMADVDEAEFAEDGPLEDLYLDHLMLKHMSYWAFTPDLQALVPADSTNS